MIKSELRPAMLEDSDLLIQWANSFDSLQWKKCTTGKISAREHNKWFRSRLLDPATQISIIMSNNVPSGQVRLEKINKYVYVDIYVDVNLRRDGIASYALKRSIKNYTDCFGSHVFYAIVHSDNISSKKLFLRNGFQQDKNRAGKWLKLCKMTG